MRRILQEQAINKAQLEEMNDVTMTKLRQDLAEERNARLKLMESKPDPWAESRQRTRDPAHQEHMQHIEERWATVNEEHASRQKQMQMQNEAEQAENAQQRLHIQQLMEHLHEERERRSEMNQDRPPTLNFPKRFQPPPPPPFRQAPNLDEQPRTPQRTRFRDPPEEDQVPNASFFSSGISPQQEEEPQQRENEEEEDEEYDYDTDWDYVYGRWKEKRGMKWSYWRNKYVPVEQKATQGDGQLTAHERWLWSRQGEIREIHFAQLPRKNKIVKWKIAIGEEIDRVSDLPRRTKERLAEAEDPKYKDWRELQPDPE